MHDDYTRRGFLRKSAAWTLVAGASCCASRTADAAPPAQATAAELLGRVKRGQKIPVIFDTDIGNGIDDTWALVMLLKSPELDVRLVLADHDNTIYRARILAKMLQVMGRTDIPVGVGPQKGDRPSRQSAWIGDYTLEQYPGKVHQDGVGALIKTIMESVDPITLVCIGPVPNIQVALEREPAIARKARFVGMHGSVYRGYGNNPKPSAEWNVRAAPKALQAVFAAPWEITLTPLDTCGIVHLTGARYQTVRQCNDPGVQALMRNYDAWAQSQDPSGKRIRPAERSSTLYDT
ncbi:MAG TPA: nucleoside hydrolase, partial [Planctomycetaceae bacterium]|nr:nucleoside hydrolase [Planctomycetaceae bacterium]